jgi:hypothetical protein
METLSFGSGHGASPASTPEAVTRLLFEVAGMIRQSGTRFVETHRARQHF